MSNGQVDLFKSKMKANGYTFMELARYLGIARQNLRLKIIGEMQFNVSELSRLRDALQLTDNQFIYLFFTTEVAENATSEVEEI